MLDRTNPILTEAQIYNWPRPKTLGHVIMLSPQYISPEPDKSGPYLLLSPRAFLKARLGPSRQIWLNY